MNVPELKKLIIQIMIGSLIGAAALAVIAVLAGSFNETFGKALFTLFLVMIHALASLAFLGQASNASRDNLKFFSNTLFILIVLSFLTSVFGVWEFVPGDLVGKLYLTYGIALFASLHGELLAKTTKKQANIDKIVYVNYLFMWFVILLLLPLVWMGNEGFPDFYFRLLAACGIVDATLTVLAVIMHKLYLQKHPEAKSALFQVVTKLDAQGNPVKVKTEVPKRRIHPLIWILAIFLAGQFLLSVVFGLLGAAWGG